jgi:hypothetical protein
LVELIESIIKEDYYDSNKLYNREYIVFKLKNGPRELRKYIKTLPEIECIDSQGNKAICTKIPQVIHVFLTGNY